MCLAVPYLGKFHNSLWKGSVAIDVTTLDQFTRCKPRLRVTDTRNGSIELPCMYLIYLIYHNDHPRTKIRANALRKIPSGLPRCF